MKGQAIVGIKASSAMVDLIFTSSSTLVSFDLPQISSVSLSPLSGKKGRTRNVAARKPALISYTVVRE
jgi:hypothetical protein